MRLEDASIDVMVETTCREDDEGFWIDIAVDRQPYNTIGPFDTPEERDRARDDFLEAMRSTGAIDVPNGTQ